LWEAQGSVDGGRRSVGGPVGRKLTPRDRRPDGGSLSGLAAVVIRGPWGVEVAGRAGVQGGAGAVAVR
jgi:hypothetical protein